MGLLFRLREKLRFTRPVNCGYYLAQAVIHSNFGRVSMSRAQRRDAAARAQGVALCLRFRNEALYIGEWIEYHLAAGADHIYLYNNFSTDNFQPVIQPYVEAGLVTLIDWPRAPASPGAEEDCVQRALGRFAWIGFIDADEFVVIRDGRGLGEFLSEYRKYPGVCLHWRMFGSAGHRARPETSVISTYTRRAPKTNAHIKSFVQPHLVAEAKNPHSWFYRHMRIARSERGRRIFGSISPRPSSDIAWLNHYYCKSEEDYIAKVSFRNVGDSLAMRIPHRRIEHLAKEMLINNEVSDECAVDYYRARCEALGRIPVLLETAPRPSGV
jgi:Glycosyltransferase family 92